MQESTILTVETTGSCLKVSGELDFLTSAQLADAVSDSTTIAELDLSGVNFIDSTGLRTLLVLRRQRPALRIAAVGLAVQRVLQVTATTELICCDLTNPEVEAPTS